MSARVDVMTGLFLIVVAATGHWIADQLSKVPRGLGPGDYPKVLLKLLLILGALLAGTASYRLLRKGPPEARKFLKGEMVRVLMLLACVALYLGLLRTFGYLLLTPLFMIAMMYLYGLRKWVRMIAIGVATSVLTYVVFNNFLYVLLPRFNLF